MRVTIEIRDEDVQPLRELAVAEGRTFRDQAAWMLRQAIATEFSQLKSEPVSTAAA
jgi:hypothetical protein